MAKIGYIGEILHCIGVRARVTGVGNLRLFLASMGDPETGVPADEVELDAIAMSTSTAVEPTKLANFESQRIQLHFRITEIDETFLITRLYMFVKPVAQDFPIT